MAKEQTITLELTKAEAAALRQALLELHEDMDDDGREGYFASTPLLGIYRKLDAQKERF